jgi:hypothetical protein
MESLPALSALPSKLFWFTWRQNNSGGIWHVNKHVAHYVSVQHGSLKEALKIIEPYFDESASCPCCGERWWADNFEVGDIPIYYTEPLYEVLRGSGARIFDSEARLHCFDGRILTLTAQGIADDPKLTAEWKRLKESSGP